MDMKMKAEDISTSGNSWDCKVVNGIVPIISEDEENLQNAILAGFLIKGTIPLLPDAGVPWPDFLTKKITFGDLDYFVRESLVQVGREDYNPQYDIQKDMLVMTMSKI